MQSHKYEVEQRLMSCGVSREDAAALRRISLTLHRWHELECGMSPEERPNVTIAVERDGDEDDSKPYLRTMYMSCEGYVDRREPCADKETGARKRLAKIMAKYPSLKPYIQGDPRGCALYIMRPGDVPEGERADAFYTRGVAVCR